MFYNVFVSNSKKTEGIYGTIKLKNVFDKKYFFFEKNETVQSWLTLRIK